MRPGGTAGRESAEQVRQAVSGQIAGVPRNLIDKRRRDLLNAVRLCHGKGARGLSIPPVSTPPPVFRSFGIPPANRPASCGGPSLDAAGCVRSLWSLLLLARSPGTGGASPPGVFGRPGMGGAPRPDGPGPPTDDTLPICGAERSFVTVFFSAFPLWISARRAPCGSVSVLLGGVLERLNRL
jgi:hypothetical protein